MIMKPTRNLILAGMLLVSTAFAQSEQWLEYHTGADGRAFHPLQISTNAPPGVVLPKLNATPYFARWETPMDAAGGRWMCFDRTGKSGPYNRVYIDNNGNGRLDDETPIQARVDSYNAYFPPAPVIFKGEDGPITYHLGLRFYQYQNSSAQVLASSAGWYEGLVNFDGVKKRVLLIDGNVNGTFNDCASDPYASDRLEIEGDKAGERFLGKLVEVGGKLFTIEAARDGAFIKVKKAENIVLGTVQVPENISEFQAFGANGHFVRQPVKGEFTLPAGQYQVFNWTINRKDDKGSPWTLSGSRFPPSANFTVAAAQPVVLKIGEPVKANLEIVQNASRQINFNLSFKGQQNEFIEMLHDGQRPRGPKLMLANADGSLCYTNTFEFG